MITDHEARAAADKYLGELQKEIGNPLQITKTQEEYFGWVFFYQSKEFIETGALSSVLAGNAPFIVNRRDGALHVLGSAYPVDVYLKEYAQLQS